MNKRVWPGIDVTLWLAYMGLIFFLSSRPAFGNLMFFSHIDKLYHTCAYGVLGVLACRAVSHLSWSPFWTIWAAGMAGSLFGITDEFHQFFVPGRSSSIGDIFADMIGSWSGAILWQVWLSPFQQRWFPSLSPSSS